MRSVIIALLIGLALPLLCATSAALAAPAGCSKELQETLGYCPRGVVVGNGLEAGASHDSGGSNGGSKHSNDTGHGSGDKYDREVSLAEKCEDWMNGLKYKCQMERPVSPEVAEQILALPAVTIADLARFAPVGTPLAGEPSNLGVAGLPANFVATASAQTQSGSLFDFPIQVRFTPVSYTFHYGDGASQTTSEGGSSWESLGQAQFTPTSTSHTYSERGTYDARVDISYSAEIDLGIGWLPVDGLINTTGPTQQIRIFEAHTALVANTCAERPAAPGC